MANTYYCQPRLYPAYSATPSGSGFPLPAQDGDGGDATHTGLAVSATLSVDLTGISASAGALFGLAGVTLTCVASGATSVQFNAGTGSTLAQNLASAINAATGAVNAAASGWTQPQLRNAVYASYSGNVLYIQTRAGSAIYNANTNWQTSYTGFTGGTVSSAQFSGGVSGAWGYLFNAEEDGILWPSSAAKYSYGCMFVSANAGCIAGPIAALTFNDQIRIRSSMGGASYTMTCGTASVAPNLTITQTAKLLVDNGTTWTADTNTTLTLNAVSGVGSAIGFYLRNSGQRLIFGSESPGRLKIINAVTSAVSQGCQVAVNGGGSLETLNIAFEDSPTYNTFWNFTAVNYSPSADLIMRGGSYRNTKLVWSSPFGQSSGQAGLNYNTILADSVAMSWAFSGTPTYIMSPLTNGVGHKQEMRNCTVSIGGSAAPYIFGLGNITAANFISNQISLVSKNNQGVLINAPLGLIAASGQNYGTSNSHVYQAGIGSSAQELFESNAILTGYLPGASPAYPAPPNAAYAYGFMWSNLQAAIHGPVEVQQLAAYVAGAVNTATVELGIDPNIISISGFDQSYINVTVNYISATGFVSVASNGIEPLVGSATLSASSGWSNLGSSWTSLVQKKITVTLPSAPVVGTYIEVIVYLTRPTGLSQAYQCFLSAEATLA